MIHALAQVHAGSSPGEGGGGAPSQADLAHLDRNRGMDVMERGVFLHWTGGAPASPIHVSK